ncbi:MAG: hypothetical protein ABH849_01415 [Nanoarchaeota archaeon]
MAYMTEHCGGEDLLDEVYSNAFTRALNRESLNLRNIAEPYTLKEGELEAVKPYAQDVYNSEIDSTQKAIRYLGKVMRSKGRRRSAGIGLLVGAAAGFAVDKFLVGGDGIIGTILGGVYSPFIGVLIETGTGKSARHIAKKEEITDFLKQKIDLDQSREQALEELSKIKQVTIVE